MERQYKGFWADLRRDHVALWQEVRDDLRTAREQCWEFIAEIRQGRQITRRMKQRITGVDNPTKRQWRNASRAVLGEVREIEEAQRRVLREFGKDGG
jgi:hypothetical protein